MASVLRETLPLDLSEPNGRAKRTLQQNVLMNNPYEANSTTYILVGVNMWGGSGMKLSVCRGLQAGAELCCLTLLSCVWHVT